MSDSPSPTQKSMMFVPPHRSNVEDIPFTTAAFAAGIPSRFEEIVRRLRDHIAIKTEETALSYTDLNAQANRVARAIIAHRGSEPEAVGILVDRGIAPAACMLAVLKSGKYFVPLDPSFPKSRLSAAIEHAAVKLLITDRHNIALARDVARGITLIEYDCVDRLIGDADLSLPVASQSLAAIVYTSGSTGDAKGVMLSHRTLLHNAMRQGIVVNVDIHDAVTVLTAGTANAISLTLFTLLHGATLFPFDVAKHGVSRMAEWLTREKISVAIIPSPLFRRLCGTAGNGRFPDVRVVRLSSESVYKSDIVLYKKHFSDACVFINGLNATEMGPVTACCIDRETILQDNDVPVGYPLPGMQTLLLDDTGQPVSINEPGEIAIKSHYLSSGYWQRPDLTREKFQCDPDDPDNVVYRTGDLGVLLPDGRLVHKGRKDFRVKIRGHGVDVVEVQKQLLAHPDVADGVVLPHKNDVGELELIAYVTSSLRPTPGASTLRRFLRQTLAPHMIPSKYVALSALPLTPNGKIDRSALPPPDRLVTSSDASPVKARNAIEARLQTIWGAVLKLHPIGTTDDFFDLGGDSLAAVELMAAIHEQFNVNLVPGSLVDSPTIQRLAARIATEREKRSAAHPFLVELQGGDRHPIFFVPGGVGGDAEFFVYTRLARHVGGDYPFYGFRARSSDGTVVAQSSVPEMAADYIAAMKAVDPHGPYFIIGECAGGIVAFEIAQQLHARGEPLALLLLMDTTRPDRLLEVRRHLKRRFNRILNGHHIMGIRFLWDQLRKRTLAEKVRYVVEKKRNIVNETFRHEPESSAQLVDRRVEFVQRSYSRAIYAYRPKPYPGPLTLLVHAELRREDDRATLGWTDVVRGEVELHPVPGSHLTYIRDHVQVAGERLRECIDRASAAHAAAHPSAVRVRGTANAS